jgi:methyl halide transferase
VSSPLNAGYWSNLYKSSDSPWDIGYVSTPLKDYFDKLHNKSISVLIPGAGNAYEAEYLIDSGFRNVYVCDYAPEPLQNFYSRCPSIKKGNLLQKDFFKLTGQFDLIVEQTFFCALERALRPAYFEKMAELLKSGGRLAGVLFNQEFEKQGPPFGGTKQEYLAYIGPAFELVVFEECNNSIKPRQGRELFFILRKK